MAAYCTEYLNKQPVVKCLGERGRFGPGVVVSQGELGNMGGWKLNCLETCAKCDGTHGTHQRTVVIRCKLTVIIIF